MNIAWDIEKHREKIGEYVNKNGGKVFVSKGVRADNTAHYFIDYIELPDYEGLMQGNSKDYYRLQHIDASAAQWYRGFKTIQTPERIITNSRFTKT